METTTTKGVRNVFRGLVLALIYVIAMIPVAILLISLVPEFINMTDPADIGPILGTLLAILAVVCIGTIFGLIGIILILVGFFTIHRGKQEYGEVHSKNVDRATIMFVLVIVMFFLSFAASMAMGLGTTALTGMTFSVVSLGMSLAGSVFTALFLYYLIKAFIPSEKENMALIAVALYVIAPIISIVGSLLIIIPADYFTDPAAYGFDMTWVLPSVVSSVISIIALIIFIVLYRLVMNRLKSGQVPTPWMGTGPFMVQPSPEQRWQPPPKT